MCLGSWDVFKFWEISGDNLEAVQERDKVAMQH